MVRSMLRSQITMTSVQVFCVRKAIAFCDFQARSADRHRISKGSDLERAGRTKTTSTLTLPLKGPGGTLRRAVNEQEEPKVPPVTPFLRLKGKNSPSPSG